MATRNLITAARLRELLHYDPSTGVFTRLQWRGGTSRVGSVVGCKHSERGHLQASIDGRLYFLHRLAWLYVYGDWPKHNIDHIDGDPSNNRIDNLRDVPQRVNCQNIRRPRSSNAANTLGVRPRGKNRFIAQLGFNGGVLYLGSFKTAEEAHEKYLEAKRKLHEGCTI